MTTAIETEYAGYRFRSRLEARWAVFFDHLGVKWLYEPQGYTLRDGRRYLPDFWLPEIQVWVEVKGAPTIDDLVTINQAAAADGLPLVYERGVPPHRILDNRDLSLLWCPLARLLVLGDIPGVGRDGQGRLHPLVTLGSGGTAIQLVFFTGPQHIEWIGRPMPMPANSVELRTFSEHTAGYTLQPGVVLDAYDAARKARFEHGESGSVKATVQQIAERMART